jgi:hypothetical protein
MRLGSKKVVSGPTSQRFVGPGDVEDEERGHQSFSELFAGDVTAASSFEVVHTGAKGVLRGSFRRLLIPKKRDLAQRRVSLLPLGVCERINTDR